MTWAGLSAVTAADAFCWIHYCMEINYVNSIFCAGAFAFFAANAADFANLHGVGTFVAVGTADNSLLFIGNQSDEPFRTSRYTHGTGFAPGGFHPGHSITYLNSAIGAGSRTVT